MAHIVSSLVAFAGDHAGLAYLLAFLLAGSEALPVIGAIVPGTAIIVALAALVPDGVLALWPLMAATTAGAIAGDGFAYWLGHHYKDGVVRIWPLGVVTVTSVGRGGEGGQSDLMQLRRRLANTLPLRL